MLVKPVPGLVMRDPVTRQFVPDDGFEVSPDDLYWARALRDGDVVELTEEEAKAFEAPRAEAPPEAAEPPPRAAKSGVTGSITTATSTVAAPPPPGSITTSQGSAA